MQRPRTPARFGVLLAITASLACGCAQLRAPQIDPTGQRIFLPAPASTTFVSPFAGTVPAAPSAGVSIFPQPAWTAPPPPPPCGALGIPQPAPVIAPPICPQPACPPAVAPPICPPAAVLPQVEVPAAPVVPALPAPAAVIPVTPVAVVGQEALALSPSRIIAPVGSQVVLLAGLRSPAGRFSPGQPIEWILSQESVGHFLEVGDECEHLLCHWRHNAPRKLTNNYAIGRTLRTDHLITRGNLNPADDILVMRGQAWLSLTSPTEGVSLVTALAPEAEGWDRRQQTAEIYWVNAQWTLPAPAHVRAGQPHALTTVITRPDTLEPVVGWIVRYEIAGGSPAAFTPQGDQAIDVTTDATGAATVQIFPQASAAGSTQVRIQIIRPGRSPHEPNRLLVGEGAATVSWSAPALSVNVSGPETVAVGTTLTYQIDVTNSGDMPTSDATATFNAPPGIVILNANPAGSIFGERIEWPLGKLAPGAAQSFTVNCRADQAGDFNACAAVQSPADGLSAEDCAVTRVVQPSISLEMSGPEQAEVGQQVQFRVVVRNTGSTPLTGVIVRDQFDEGFEHAQAASPIENVLGDIAPGQEKPFAVTFRVVKPGRWCHLMTATTATGQTATAQACLVATEPPPPQLQPGVTARAWGPRELQAGQTGEYFVEVLNSGQTPLTGIRVAVGLGPSLRASQATADHQQIGGQLVWTIDRLEAGDARRFQINTQALQPDPQAIVRAEVTASEQVQDAAQATTRIVAAPQPPAQTQPAPSQKPEPQPQPAPAKEGRLEITVDDLSDPVKAGQSLTYVVVVKNTRNDADRNLALTVTLPENARLVRLNGPTTISRVSPNGRTLELAPVLEVRPNESLPPWRIEVTPTQPGQATLRVEATSAAQPQAIIVEEETTIVP